jgi:hypothetical protein
MRQHRSGAYRLEIDVRLRVARGREIGLASRSIPEPRPLHRAQ